MASKNDKNRDRQEFGYLNPSSHKGLGLNPKPETDLALELTSRGVPDSGSFNKIMAAILGISIPLVVAFGIFVLPGMEESAEIRNQEIAQHESLEAEDQRKQIESQLERREAAMETEENTEIESYSSNETKTNASEGVTRIELPFGPIVIGVFVIGGIAALSGSRGSAERRKLNKQKTALNTIEWEALIARHNHVLEEWKQYELDPVKILDFPFLADIREEATLELHRAIRNAKTRRPGNVSSVSLIPAVESPYANAVNELEDKFRIAESEARRIRWSKFTINERKRLQKAKDLLSIAIDSGAGEHERQVAYKRMQKELNGLIVVPKTTIHSLEKKLNLALTDG